MKNLVSKLRRDYPMIDFFNSQNFKWSSEKQQISYIEQVLSTNRGQWTLLHELGHALCGHKNYTYDLELLEMEVSAWEKAQEISESYNIEINQNHIEDCLDTYRDWLHLRSTCLQCKSVSVQKDTYNYQCFNCENKWRVTSSRLTRPYRISI